MNGTQQNTVSTEHLVEPAEKQLYELLEKQEIELKKALLKHDYNHAYTLIATIQPALAVLFSVVKILADDPKIKANRLALLQRVFNLFDEMLDFSKIQE